MGSRTRLETVLGVIAALLVGSVLVALPARAADITLSKLVGPPSSSVAVSGAGFSAGETVDVFFDSTRLVAATADAGGRLPAVTIRVPKTALPGTHWISVVGRVTGVSAQASFLVRANWSQFRYWVDHRGVNPVENVLSRANVGQLALRWTFQGSYAFESSPSVANGIVYVGGGDSRIYAFDATTGDQVWTFATQGYVDPSPAVANGMVYVGSADGTFYALDAVTGAMRWSFPAGSRYSSPSVVNGVVYVGADYGDVYALRASDGAQLWRVHLADQVYTAPAVVNGNVYVAADKLYKLDATTGARRWAFRGAGEWFGSSPAIVKGTVYETSADGTIFAVNAITGAKRWAFATHAPELRSKSPAIANGTLYVSVEDEFLYALDASTGGLRWRTYAGRVASSIAVANGVIYLGSWDQRVHAFATSDGSELWTFQTGSTVSSSPAVANGMVYVGSRDRHLYAFGLPTAAPTPVRLDPRTLDGG